MRPVRSYSSSIVVKCKASSAVLVPETSSTSYTPTLLRKIKRTKFCKETVHDGDRYAYISCRFAEYEVTCDGKRDHGLVHTVKPSANFSVIGYTRHLRREGGGGFQEQVPF